MVKECQDEFRLEIAGEILRGTLSEPQSEQIQEIINDSYTQCRKFVSSNVLFQDQVMKLM